MSKNEWNERYSADEFIYGTNPNEFFKEKLQDLKTGKLLLPCEGEGRNSVYAAKCGWDVTAFDQSDVAMLKAMELAKSQNVSINYFISSVNDVTFAPETFDALALIYAHYPPDFREVYHKKFLSYLKPGGFIIIEAFSKEQINFDSGGPKNSELLYSNENLIKDFKSLSKIDITELNVELSEGQYHSGNSSVIRLFGTK